MTLVQLRHLIALAETGSFSRSAEKLFLTQPALSRSIRALEDELGHTLFDRVGKHSELTAFGLEMLARSRQLVADADEMRLSGPRLSRGSGGHLRIGLGSGPGALLMTPLMLHVAKHHPALKLSVARGGTDLLVQALRARSLDALVVDARSLEPAADLQTEIVGELPGAFLCRKGHPLTRGRKAIRFEQIRAYPIASTPLSDDVARTLIERYGPRANPHELVGLRCDEIPSLVELVRGSDAILLAARSTGPDLVELRIEPALEASARFGLITLSRRTPPPGLGLLTDFIRCHLH